jgi:short-subunit dehydrogenase
MTGNHAPVTLISGAASGIGRHMAIALARLGHRLVLTDIDAEGLGRLVREQAWAVGEAVTTQPMDVRDEAAWDALITRTAATVGRIDTMLHLAGFLTAGNVLDIDVELIDRQIDVNVKGTIYATRAAAKQMRAQGFGHIINAASIAGLSHVPGLAVYCASKHAVRGFTLSVAHEVRPHNVYVTVFCPDAVETPMLRQQEDAPEAAMTFGARRALTLEEVEVALLSAMRTRPLEVLLSVPFSGRALGARIANMVPPVTGWALHHVRKRGRRVQEQRLRRQP